MVAHSQTTSNAIPLGERAALSVRDTCACLGVGRTTVYKLLEEQKLRSIKIGDRRLVLRASVDELLAQASA